VVERINGLVKGAYGQLLNYFHASLKLERKEPPRRLKRITERPKRPWQRVLPARGDAQQATLGAEEGSLNPFALKRESPKLEAID